MQLSVSTAKKAGRLVRRETTLGDLRGPAVREAPAANRCLHFKLRFGILPTSPRLRAGYLPVSGMLTPFSQ
jgi:hypothetical protein